MIIKKSFVLNAKTINSQKGVNKMTKQISKKYRRLFALLLAVVMMFSVMPMNAIAVTSTNVNEDGYIEIDSIEDLYLINQDLTANYILTADIDMTEATAVGGDWDFDSRGWSPIGSNDIYEATAFSGTFDGNGHKIIGMRIDVTSLPSGSGNDVYLGLFSSSTGIIKNLELKDINVNFNVISKDCYIGGVSAVAESGQLFNINVSGNINSETYCNRNDTNGDINYVGGIVGKNNSEIFNCYNECSIIAYDGRNNSPRVAGIAGKNENIIDNCYNLGTISSTYYYVPQSSSALSGTRIGVASSIANDGTIKNSYNLGSTNRYAISNGEVTNCYYLQSDLTGVTGAKPLTKGQMKLEYMYEGFDFENVWVLDTNAIYPYPQLRDNPKDIRVISNVSITPPAKTLYYLNEDIDLTGCVVKFEFENAESEVINVTADMVTGFDAAKLGEQELTVTCYDREITFTVNVSELPYKEIRTIEDLYNIRNDLAGNYILMNDIDLTEATAEGGDYDYEGRGWNPIGSNDIYEDREFSGIFNGNGYSIIGMRIDAVTNPTGTPATNYGGLFTNVTGKIKNLHMKNVNISHGLTYSGAITAKNSGIITNCSVSGYVHAYYYCGGLVGNNIGSIELCYNTADVKADLRYAGGIAAVNNGTISNCYNTASVEGGSGYYTGAFSSTYYYYAAGITGYNNTTDATNIAKVIEC